MAFNKHLSLSWKLEDSVHEKMVTVDHTDPMAIFTMETWLKTHALADELSDGVLVIPDEKSFEACNEKARELGLISA